MELVNKVAQSGLVTLDLEAWYPADKLVSFDLKPFLFRELLLKEKDFRAALSAIDWTHYQDKIMAVHCSNDAIIPQWAFMLVAVYATPYAPSIYFGTEEMALAKYYEDIIEHLPLDAYQAQRVVIKGCSKHPVPVDAYLAATRKLRTVAKSIMYGEPCSTVPLYKRKEA